MTLKLYLNTVVTIAKVCGEAKMTPEYYSIAQVADILSVSKETLRRWDNNGTLVPQRHPENNYRVYHRSQIEHFEQAQVLFNSKWDDEISIKPKRNCKFISYGTHVNISIHSCST